MDAAIILGTVATLISGGGLATLLLLPSKRKADELQNEGTASQQWRELYEKAEQESTRKSDLIDKQYNDIKQYRDELNKYSTDNAVLTIMKCDVRGCVNRKPPTGY